MVEPALSPKTLAAIRAGDEALDRGLRGAAPELALLRDAGLLAAPLPVALGGHGWGTSPDGALPMLDALVALGGASLAVARLYEGHVNAVKLVTAFGTLDQREQVAECVLAGAVTGVWGADSEQPVAIDQGRLRGVKAFASGLGDLRLAVVTARSAQRLQMILTDVQDPMRADLANWDVDAMVGSRSGRFDCTGLPAGPDHMLGPPDALFAEPDFHGGLWRLSACYAGALGRMARLVGAMVALDTRLSPLAQHRLGQIAMEAQGALLWATSACLAVELGEAPPEAAVCAALFAREAVDGAAMRVLPLAERLAGTAMHRRASPLGRLARDLRFYLRQADLDGKLALATQHWWHGAPCDQAP